MALNYNFYGGESDNILSDSGDISPEERLRGGQNLRLRLKWRGSGELAHVGVALETSVGENGA